MHIEQHRQAGRAPNAPALYATVDPDTDLVEIRDGVGPMLSMSRDQAVLLVDELAALLRAWSR